MPLILSIIALFLIVAFLVWAIRQLPFLDGFVQQILIALVVVVGVIIALGWLLGFVPRAWGHDWYSSLQNTKGEMCCNASDCGPVRTAGLSIYWHGEWVLPEPWKNVRSPSPTGETHACGSPAYLRCVIRPLEA